MTSISVTMTICGFTGGKIPQPISIFFMQGHGDIQRGIDRKYCTYYALKTQLKEIQQ